MIIEVVNRTDSKSTAEEARDIIYTISAMDLDDQTRERVEKNAMIISKNIAMMPSDFEKLDSETGGCLTLIRFVIYWGIFLGIILLLAYICD